MLESACGSMEKRLNPEAEIGVFDSGVGGISVLKAACSLMPEENFVYLGDTLHAPYGERTLQEIHEIVLQAAELLLRRGIKALLVACNTATAAAIADLRTELKIPVVGVEPALKPACAAFPQGGNIAVMATPATLSLHKFAALRERYATHVHVEPLPCPGLSRLIERSEPFGDELMAYLTDLFSAVNTPADAVVIGCTHYSFIHREISAVTGGVPIFDGAYSTALHLRCVLQDQALLRGDSAGRVEFLTTGDSTDIGMYQRFFKKEIIYV